MQPKMSKKEKCSMDRRGDDVHHKQDGPSTSVPVPSSLMITSTKATAPTTVFPKATTGETTTTTTTTQCNTASCSPIKRLTYDVILQVIFPFLNLPFEVLHLVQICRDPFGKAVFPPTGYPSEKQFRAYFFEKLTSEVPTYLIKDYHSMLGTKDNFPLDEQAYLIRKEEYLLRKIVSWRICRYCGRPAVIQHKDLYYPEAEMISVALPRGGMFWCCLQCAFGPNGNWRGETNIDFDSDGTTLQILKRNDAVWSGGIVSPASTMELLQKLKSAMIRSGSMKKEFPTVLLKGGKKVNVSASLGGGLRIQAFYPEAIINLINAALAEVFSPGGYYPGHFTPYQSPGVLQAKDKIANGCKFHIPGFSMPNRKVVTHSFSLPERAIDGRSHNWGSTIGKHQLIGLHQLLWNCLVRLGRLDPRIELSRNTGSLTSSSVTTTTTVKRVESRSSLYASSSSAPSVESVLRALPWKEMMQIAVSFYWPDDHWARLCKDPVDFSDSDFD